MLGAVDAAVYPHSFAEVVMTHSFEIVASDDALLDDCCVVFIETFAADPWFEVWPIAVARVRLRELLGVPRSIGLAAVDGDGQVEGFAIGHFVQTATASAFRIDELCVHPRRQGHGLGTVLMGQIEARARAAGATIAYLTTGPETSGFYHALGYAPEPEWISMSRSLEIEPSNASAVTDRLPPNLDQSSDNSK